MTFKKTTFEQIEEGLKETLAISRGEAHPHSVHYPSDRDLSPTEVGTHYEVQNVPKNGTQPYTTLKTPHFDVAERAMNQRLRRPHMRVQVLKVSVEIAIPLVESMVQVQQEVKTGEAVNAPRFKRKL